MNEHGTVVPSSRRVVGLLFPSELSSLLVVVWSDLCLSRLMLVGCYRCGWVRPGLCCGSPSGVTSGSPIGVTVSRLVESAGFSQPAWVMSAGFGFSGTPRRRQQRLE